MMMTILVEQRAAVTNTGLKKQPPVDSIQPHCDEVDDDDSDEVDDDNDGGGGGDDGYSIHLRVQACLCLTDLCAVQWSD